MRRNTDRPGMPKLIATASIAGILSLATSAPALAVELGDVRVESTLGQPLRVSIPFTLNPDEQMYDFCIRLRQGAGDAAIPSVTRARVSVSGNRIVIAGEPVIRDPLLNLQVAVDCPYTPQITRQYTLVVDPVEFADNDRLLASQPVLAQQAATVTPAREPGEPAAATQPERAVEQPVASDARAAAPTAASSADRPPVMMNTEYRVQSGDSASGIAARIDGRPNSLSDAVAQIVANNPDAFVDGDPARLMSGSLLRIPAMTAQAETTQMPDEPGPTGPREYAPIAATGAASPVDEVAMAPDPAPFAEPAPSNNVADNVEPVTEPAAEVEAPVAETLESVTDADTVEIESAADVSATSPESPEEAPVAEPVEAVAGLTGSEIELPADDIVPAAADATADIVDEPVADELQPGDVILPVAANTDSRATRDAVPSVAPVVGTSGSDTGDSWSWLTWPIGVALLLVGGILLLGRRIRGAFSSIAIGAPDKPQADPGMLQEVSEPAADAPEPDLEATEPVMEAPEPVISAPEPVVDTPEPDIAEETAEAPQPVVDDVDVDFEFTETVATDSISLDADLDAGTGLQDGTDLDVAEDFGFSATSPVANDVDHEIPEEAALEPEQSPTDVIPPTHREDVATILEEESVPESDDYDLSMIVDATKQSIGDTELTAQDLQAVPVDDTGSDEYTISDDTMTSEADLAALEQDYEEEYTQTQALSKEIEEAAAELAAKLDDDIDDDDPTIDEPALTIEDPGLDPTAQMPSHSATDDATAQMPASVSADDLTSEMPTDIASMDETAEMQIDDITAEVTVRLAPRSDAENDALADDEVTAKLAVAANEPTVEMPLDADSSDEDKTD